MNRYALRGEEQLVWPHTVIVSLAFFLSALFVVGLLSLVFDTLP
jgi:hypothetical protein